MAQYDPEGPADNAFDDRSYASSPPEPFAAGEPGAGSREFVAYTPRWMPATFWGALVRSQQTASDESTTGRERVVGVQSAQFWAALVRSQRPADQGDASEESYGMWLPSDRPAGRIGFIGDASEWSREPRAFESVQSAAEPIEIEASARRDDVEWSAPASSNEDWASARSEGLSYDGTMSAPPKLAAKRSPAATAVERTAKVRTAKRTGVKKRAAKKAAPAVAKAKKAATAKAKKPAPKTTKSSAKKPVAKKFVVKKLVKKTTPAPRITKAPTRRAA